MLEIILKYFFFLLSILIAADASEDIFPLGKQLSFDFTNDVFVHDFKGGKPVAYRLKAVLKVATIFADATSRLLKFDLESPALHVRPHGSLSQTEFAFHASPLDLYENQPFYAIWNKKNISEIYVAANENSSLVNLKKGIVSLFQFKTESGDFLERDASGLCKVTYRDASPSSFYKTKHTCRSKNEVHVFTRPEKALHVRVQSHRSNAISFLPSGAIESIEGRDYFHISLEVNPKIGNSVDSFMALQTDNNISDVKPIDVKSPKKFLLSLKKYTSEPLEAVAQIVPVSPDATFRKLVKNYSSDLNIKHIGTGKTASAFVELLPLMRRASQSDVLKIFNDKSVAENRVRIYRFSFGDF